LEKTAECLQSEANLISAMTLLRQRCLALKRQNPYLELRFRNQHSVVRGDAGREFNNEKLMRGSQLFSLLTHMDAEINIELAHASRELAEATRKDGSSMKTIAILSMIFLPATFFSPLTSMPFLHWDEAPVIQDRFWVYWAFTIPVTIITFLIGLL